MVTAIAMVRINRPTTTQAPCCKSALSVTGSGWSFPTAKLRIDAVTTQFTTEGMNRAKNSWKCTTPFCQTIRVVISPKGLNAPPAFAATTILIQAMAMNLVLLPPTATATAAINRAVVRLSAIGDITKASPPVIQKILRSEKPCVTSQTRRTSNTPRSSIVLMKVIAANRNRNSSTNSSRSPRISTWARSTSPACMKAIATNTQIRPAATITGLDFLM